MVGIVRLLHSFHQRVPHQTDAEKWKYPQLCRWLWYVPVWHKRNRNSALGPIFNLEDLLRSVYK